MHGSNAALINMNDDLVNSILRLPNIGLNNDQAIANEVIKVGGLLERITDKKALMKTEGDHYPSVLSAAKYLLRGKEPAYLGKGSRFAGLEVFNSASSSV